MTSLPRIEFDREVDGRWIGEAVNLPGVLIYGRTRREAKAKVLALLEEVLAEQQSDE